MKDKDYRRAHDLNTGTRLDQTEADVWALWERSDRPSVAAIAEQTGLSADEVETHLASVREKLTEARTLLVEVSPGQRRDERTGANYNWELPLSTRPVEEMAPWAIERELQAAALAYVDLRIIKSPRFEMEDEYSVDRLNQDSDDDGAVRWAARNWGGVSIEDRLETLLDAVTIDPETIDPFDERGKQAAMRADVLEEINSIINIWFQVEFGEPVMVEFVTPDREKKMIERFRTSSEEQVIPERTEQAKRRVYRRVQQFSARHEQGLEAYCGGVRISPPDDWDGSRREWYEDGMEYSERIPQPIIERILDGRDPKTILDAFEVDGSDLLFHHLPTDEADEQVYLVDDGELVELIDGEVRAESRRYRLATDAFTEGSEGLIQLSEGSDSEQAAGG